MKEKLKRQKSVPNVNIQSPVKVTLDKNTSFIHRPSNSLQHARFLSKMKGKQTCFRKTIENFLKAYVNHSQQATEKTQSFDENIEKTKLYRFCDRSKSRQVKTSLPSASNSPVLLNNSKKVNGKVLVFDKSSKNLNVLKIRDPNIQVIHLKKCC
jgi:hypothetical protein